MAFSKIWCFDKRAQSVLILCNLSFRNVQGCSTHHEEAASRTTQWNSVQCHDQFQWHFNSQSSPDTPLPAPFLIGLAPRSCSFLLHSTNSPFHIGWRFRLGVGDCPIRITTASDWFLRLCYWRHWAGFDRGSRTVCWINAIYSPMDDHFKVSYVTDRSRQALSLFWRNSKDCSTLGLCRALLAPRGFGYVWALLDTSLNWTTLLLYLL